MKEEQPSLTPTLSPGERGQQPGFQLPLRQGEGRGEGSARTAILCAGLAALGALAIALGIATGSAGWLGQGAAPDLSGVILWEIRLPRALGAWLAGALLALAGAIAQGLFRNPLADPFLLGSASGAALAVALSLVGLTALGGSGAALSGLSWLPRLGLAGAAFIGAALGVGLSLLLAKGAAQGLRLLLAGVVVGVVLGAITSLITSRFPETLTTMQSFNLGTTAFVSLAACALMAAALLPGWFAAVALARGLDALALGEATAQSLGLPLAKLRWALVALLALCTGVAVAQMGLVAFVGLAAPHLARALGAVQHRALLLLAPLVGGLLLAVADALARGLTAPNELPVGVVTALVGGAYLLLRLHRRPL